MRNSMKEVEQLLQAKFECIWINTYEEEQAIEDIKEIAKRMNDLSAVYTWSHTEGARRLPLSDEEKPENPDPKTVDPGQFFNRVASYQNSETRNRNIWILRDVHHLADAAMYKRKLRDLKEYKSSNHNPLVVVAPTVNIPMEHEKLFRVIDYDLPCRSAIKEIIDSYIPTIEAAIKKQENNNKTVTYQLPTEEEKERIIRSLQGLTYNEIRSVLRESLIKEQKLSTDIISEQKIQLVRKSGALDCLETNWTLEDMGGNHAFKEWLLENAEIMKEDAQSFANISIQPKGYAAIGIPGSSKTMSAEVVANLLGVPLLKLSMNKIMNRFVGESEKKASQAFRVAEANAPCVLLLDEVEKMLGGKRVFPVNCS